MDNNHKEETNKKLEEEEEEEEENKQPKTIMGIFTREQFIMLCVAVGLVLLLIIITIPAVIVTQSSGK